MSAENENETLVSSRGRRLDHRIELLETTGFTSLL